LRQPQQIGFQEVKAADDPSKLVEVDSSFAGHGPYPFGLEGFQCLGGKAQTNKPLALLPPDAFPLQVNLLQTLGTPVGVGDGESVVAFFCWSVGSDVP